MAMKPLNKYAPRKGSKVDREDAGPANEFDRDADTSFTDNFGEGDPNAKGPTMRPVYDEYATSASHWADQHDANPEDVPYPRIQRGSVAAGFRGRTGDDERAGPGGPAPTGYPYAGKQGKERHIGENDGVGRAKHRPASE